MYPAILTLLLALLPTVHSQTSSPSPPDYTSDSAFEAAILNSTNFYRLEYNASALTWNTTLATFASSYASACNFKHSGSSYGENLASGFPNSTAAVEAWGNEGLSYNYGAATFSEGTGHFTQLVWKATTSTGCGRMNCSGENGTPGWFVVCEYYPPGNYLGEFGVNVDKPVRGSEAAIESGESAASSVRVGDGWGGIMRLVGLVVAASVVWVLV